MSVEVQQADIPDKDVEDYTESELKTLFEEIATMDISTPHMVDYSQRIVQSLES